MKKKAIIFDMDGVLVDTENAYLNMFRDFLRAHGKSVREDILLKIVGADSKKTWKYMGKLWGEEDTEKIRQLFHSEYPDGTLDYREYLFPGVPQMLRTLKQKNYLLALASSSKKKDIRRMLKENELGTYFTVVVSGEEYKESKPDPEIYNDVKRQLELNSEECLVVEDSTYGIRAAKAAGLEVIAVDDPRFSFDQSEADGWIKKVTDLLSLV